MTTVTVERTCMNCVRARRCELLCRAVFYEMVGSKCANHVRGNSGQGV